MAIWDSIKAIVDQYITTNGQGDITGASLNTVLKSMIDALGDGCLYKGIATPASNPGTPDGPVFYIALEAGTYTNFGGNVLSNGLTILKWDSAWTVSTIFRVAAGSDFASPNSQQRSYLPNVGAILDGSDSEPLPDSTKVVNALGVINAVGRIAELPANKIEGQFVTAWSTIASNSDFFYTSPFLVPANTVITVWAKGYAQNVSIISTSNENASEITARVTSPDNTWRKYTYRTATQTYIIISANKNTPVYYVCDYVDNVTQLNSDVQLLRDNLLKTDYIVGPSVGTVTTGGAAQISNGKVVIGGGSSYYRYLLYQLNGESYFQAYCTATSSLNYGAGIICTDANNNVLWQYNEATGGNYTKKFKVPVGTAKIYLNGSGINPVLNVMTGVPAVNYDYVDYTSPKLTLSLFQNIGVVGDSYASGCLHFSGTYVLDYAISWPQQIARQFGINAFNYADEGLSTRSWLSSSKGLSKVLSDPARDVYLLVLGINDYYNLGISYLGSITDITSHSSYTDYGDTFYGNYGRIIEQIMAHAPHAKLIMFGVVNNDTVPAQFNAAIQEIAEHYSIMYINQRDDDFYKNDIYTDMAGGHPTALGYSMMAVAFSRLICKCVIDNPDYFKNYHMYSS